MEDKKIKCVIWDLDNTLWDGILSEGDKTEMRPSIRKVLYELDKRGILQSVCSKNDYAPAMRRLQDLGISDLFLYPQISWDPKSTGIRRIKDKLNIGFDSLAFIDDQAFEREEVSHHLPEVVCIDAAKGELIPDDPMFQPRFITADSSQRRVMYQADRLRNEIQDEFEGTEEEFLKTLDMKFYVARVCQDDLMRAEELTVRTHQLNSTGVTFSYEELDRLSHRDDYLLLIASLTDKYGDYGKIGLAVIEKGQAEWQLKLLLMSCRVMSRGVGTVLLNLIKRKAKESGKGLVACFIPNDRNRIMKITYQLAGFHKTHQDGEMEILRANLDKAIVYPDYISIEEGEI